MELPLDHVAIAVTSIPDALPFYEMLTGSRATAIERIESQGVDVAFLGDGARIELLQPCRADSTVQRFLDRRGPGLHHIAYQVPDIRGVLARLREAGVRLIDTEPRTGAHGHLVAFIHPESSGGVLVELVQR